MISSKFFIINQGIELGDKTPIPPLMGAKPLRVFPLSFSLLPFSFSSSFTSPRLASGSASLCCVQGLEGK